MSDEEYEQNKTEAQKEGIRRLKKRIPVDQQSAKELNLTVSVESQDIEEMQGIYARVARELTELGENTSKEEVNARNWKEKAKHVQDLKKLHRQVEANADPTNKPSSGTLSLEGNRQNDDGEGDSWDSVESMINDIQRIKRTGTSAQKKRAQEVLNKMLLKSLSGSKQKAELEGKFVKTYESKDEEGVIEKLNREFRERRKLKKDVEK
jgi:uncharacterized protein (DUF2147 family)